MKYSTCIGIDTHAKKNAVCALDTVTGEVREALLCEDPGKLIAWIADCWSRAILATNSRIKMAAIQSN